MKKSIYYFGFIAIVFVFALSFSSCDNDDEGNIVVDEGEKSRLYGRWVCTYSKTYVTGTPVYEQEDGRDVGAVITLNSDNTYWTSLPDIGSEGTWWITQSTTETSVIKYLKLKDKWGDLISVKYTFSGYEFRFVGDDGNDNHFSYRFRKSDN